MKGSYWISSVLSSPESNPRTAVRSPTRTFQRNRISTPSSASMVARRSTIRRPTPSQRRSLSLRSSSFTRSMIPARFRG
ncbi:ubiquitin-40S ribosomal protein s27a [Phtheirospermum japonicum]|uniref:Ubiquitin-40S ribosomal protein s27a n=1 Tax=Phtheirospermum japonicum TaxID=374723 RepID=A0A830C5X3_9LAMI|nr:ubiquitin-40S ribosomal protein s27a [Phtheirospermum japonicum]